MSVYSAPEGYQLDPNTGLYYSQVISENASGMQVQAVTWFNADTGEYAQYEYPMEPIASQSPTEVPESAVSTPFSKVKSFGAIKITLAITASITLLGVGAWKLTSIISNDHNQEADYAKTVEEKQATAVGADQEMMNLLLELAKKLEAREIEEAAVLAKSPAYLNLITEIGKENKYRLDDSLTEMKDASIIAYGNGTYYFGNTNQDIREGTGIFLNTTQEQFDYYSYDGEWSNDLPNGHGVITEVSKHQEYDKNSGVTSTDKVISTGNFENGLYNGLMDITWYMNNGGEHHWSEIEASKGVFLLSPKYENETEHGQYVVAYDLNDPETLLWDDGTVYSVLGTESAFEDKMVSEDEPQNADTARFDGVYRGEGFTIVLATGAPVSENYGGQIPVMIDMGYDVFFAKTPRVVSDDEIEIFTYNEDDTIITEIHIVVESDTMHYHRLLHEDGYEDSIVLKKTDEDPLTIYGEYMKLYQDDYEC